MGNHPKTEFFVDELMCSVRSLHYKWTNRTGTLFLPPGCCVDMEGTIALFQRIDPKVLHIYTVAGGKADTIYHKEKGRWQAFDPVISDTEQQP